MRKVILFIGLLSFFAFGLLKPSIEIDGNGKSWDLITKGSLTVPTGDKLTLKSVTVNKLQGTVSSSRLVMSHSTSQLVLENSTLSLDGNYSFTQGSLVVKGDCTITGTAGTLFTFNGHNILIDNSATLRIKNVTFQAAPTSGIRQLVRYGNSKSKLLLKDATFKCNNAPSGLLRSGGFVMVGGGLVIEGSSVVDNTGTSSMHALQLGNGSYSSSDCRLVVCPSSKLTVRNAGIVFKSVGVGSLDLSGGEGTLDVETGANFLIETLVNLDGSTFNFDFLRLAGLSRTTFSSMGTPIDGVHGGNLRGVNWSPDGQYLSGSGAGTYNFKVYSFDGASFISLGNSINIHGGAGSLYSASWHATGLFVAVGGARGTANYTNRFYGFDGTATTSLLGSMFDHGASVVWSVDWSPDGRYLAIGGNSASNVTHRVYSFDGSVTVTLPGCNKDHGSQVRSVNWSPDGKFLAIGGFEGTGGYEIRVYSFDGTGLTELIGCRKDVGVSPLVDPVDSVSWSPDGKYLAVGGQDDADPGPGYDFRVYSFDGSSLTLLDLKDHGVGAFVRTASWSSDGKYLATVGDSGLSTRVYLFDGSSLGLLDDGDHGGGVFSTSWYPDDRYLALGGFAIGGISHRAYPSVYSSSNALAQLQNATLNLGGGAFRLDNIELKGN